MLCAVFSSAATRRHWPLLIISLQIVAGARLMRETRKPHEHVSLVAGCMASAALPKCEVEWDASDLQFTSYATTPLVGIAGGAISPQETRHLMQLATCVAHVGTEQVDDGQWDPHSALPVGSQHAEDREFFEGGNRVIFLNEFLQRLLPDFYWRLRKIAESAVAAGSFDTSGAERPEELGIRCIEVLQYRNTGFTAELGWHTDTDSIYTYVMLLSNTGHDFIGGSFRIQDNAGNRTSVVLDPAFGGGMIFDSERSHAVEKLKQGRRTVLVIEFWKMADTTAFDSRPEPQWGAPVPVLQVQGSRPGCLKTGGVYQKACWE